MVAIPQPRFPFLSYVWVYVQLTENQPAHCQFPLCARRLKHGVLAQVIQGTLQLSLQSCLLVGMAQ